MVVKNMESGLRWVVVFGNTNLGSGHMLFLECRQAMHIFYKLIFVNLEVNFRYRPFIITWKVWHQKVVLDIGPSFDYSHVAGYRSTVI